MILRLYIITPQVWGLEQRGKVGGDFAKLIMQRTDWTSVFFHLLSSVKFIVVSECWRSSIPMLWALIRECSPLVHLNGMTPQMALCFWVPGQSFQKYLDWILEATLQGRSVEHIKQLINPSRGVYGRKGQIMIPVCTCVTNKDNRIGNKNSQRIWYWKFLWTYKSVQGVCYQDWAGWISQYIRWRVLTYGLLWTKKSSKIGESSTKCVNFVLINYQYIVRLLKHDQSPE